MSKRSALSIPGIYTITNTVTGKVYVGQSINIRVRWIGHRSELRRGIHKNQYLQIDWDCFGVGAFKFAVAVDLTHVPANGLTTALNQAEVDILSAALDSYNINEAGDGGTVYSEETRRLWSDQRKALWTSMEFRAKQRASIKALYADPAWKAARDAAVREAKGAPHVRKAVSKQMRQLWRDPAHRASQAQQRTINWQDPEYRAQQIASRKATWNDPEVRRKRSEGIRAAHARRKAAESAV